MPIIPRHSPLLADVPTSITEWTGIALPDQYTFSERAGGSSLAGSIGAETAFRLGLRFQGSGQIAMANIASNVGIPNEMFGTVRQLFQIDPVEEALGQYAGSLGSTLNILSETRFGNGALRQMLDVAMGIVLDTLLGALEGVPIVGWIVEGAVAVGKLVKMLVDVVHADRQRDRHPDEPILPPTVFSPELDNLVTDRFLAVLRRSKDWGHLFGPPVPTSTYPWGGAYRYTDPRTGQVTTADIAHIHSPFIYAPLTNGGYRISTSWNDATVYGNPYAAFDNWSGMIPGTYTLHQGIEKSRNTFIDVGTTLYPSARTLLFWAWRWVVGSGATATPALYCIDPEDLRAWNGYLEALKEFIMKEQRISSADRTRILDQWHKTEGNMVFGWKDATPYPLKLADRLEKRQNDFLDSLLVAYVDESFAAIYGDNRRKWKQRRRLLLEHPDRCKIDIDNVPDAAYREELIARGVGGTRCMLTGGVPQSFAAGTSGFTPPKHTPDAAGGTGGAGGFLMTDTPTLVPSSSLALWATGIAGTVAATSLMVGAYMRKKK